MDPPASREISLTVRWLWGLSDSATATQLCRRFHQCASCALHLPLSGRLSTVPNFTSSLWMLFFVQPLSKNSVITTERCKLYIHTDFWSKFCLLYWTASKLAHLLDTASKLTLFSLSDLKDEKLVKSEPIWKLKHAISLLETFEYFCQNRSFKFRAIPFQSWVVFWDTVYTWILDTGH